MKIALLLTLLILAPGLMAQDVESNNSTDHAAAVQPEPVPAADPAQAQADLLLAYKKEYAFLTSQVNNIKSRLAEYKQNAATEKRQIEGDISALENQLLNAEATANQLEEEIFTIQRQ